MPAGRGLLTPWVPIAETMASIHPLQNREPRRSAEGFCDVGGDIDGAALRQPESRQNSDLRQYIWRCSGLLPSSEYPEIT